MNPRIWRFAACAIAVLAVIDPALRNERSTRPVVSIVAATFEDSDAAREIVRELSGEFTAVEGALPGAAATVVVGDQIPERHAELAAPTFAVSSRSADAHVSIVRVDASRTALADARVPVAVTLRASPAHGDSVVVTLHAANTVVDRTVVLVDSAGGAATTTMWYVPSATGAVRLRVSAEMKNRNRRDSADVAIDVHQARWPVLFFDRRPSWMSTFVRRAIESDPRFAVTSRTMTSRNLSTDAGTVPESFDAIAAGELYNAVVIGAPELLTDRDVAGLEAYMRRRGGGVVLLFDSPQAGRHTRLTQVERWSTATRDSAFAILPDEPGQPNVKASEIAWPSVLPPGAEAVATAGGRTNEAASRPVVWRSGVGAGRLVVSGALNAWAFRDTSQSDFAVFWRSTVAHAAAGTPPAISVTIPQPIARPGDRVAVDVYVRDEMAASVASANTDSSVRARLEGNGERIDVTLWPTSTPGKYRGMVRAPSLAGTYRVSANARASRNDAPLVVSADAAPRARDEADVLSAWVMARSGRVFSRPQVAELTDALTAAIAVAPRPELWHPMRSPWWIIPFALALGSEWLWRRRRGMA